MAAKHKGRQSENRFAPSPRMSSTGVFSASDSFGIEVIKTTLSNYFDVSRFLLLCSNKIHQPTCLGQSLVHFCEETSFVNLSSHIHLKKITCKRSLPLRPTCAATRPCNNKDHDFRGFSVDFISPNNGSAMTSDEWKSILCQFGKIEHNRSYLNHQLWSINKINS